MNEALIITELGQWVGFRQPTKTEFAILEAKNLVADSGLYFEDGDPLVTIENVKMSQDDETISDTDYNTLLENLKNDVVIDVCKQIVQSETESLERRILFPYEQTFVTTKTLDDGFVSVRIEPNIFNVTLTISQIAISFDGAAAIPIKLIHSETGEEISGDTTTITSESNKGVSKRTNIKFSLNSDGLGGAYDLGYFTTDISSLEPYERNYQLADNWTDTSYFNTEFRRYNVSGGRLLTEEFDVIQEPYGLNFQYHVETDYTQLLIENKSSLTAAFQLKFAERVSELILKSTRSNPHSQELDDKARNLANLAISGGNGYVGIRERLNNEIKSIKKQLFPKPAIVYGTLG